LFLPGHGAARDLHALHKSDPHITKGTLRVRTMHMSKTPKKTKRKTVANIGRDECRWPIGDPRHADFHFCGAPQVPGRPYCELHWRMAFVPARARQAQPARSSPDRHAA
jgi:hypothetical protein